MRAIENGAIMILHIQTLVCAVKILRLISQIYCTFDMHFAGRDLYILLICIIHVVIINSKLAMVTLKQISSEDHVISGKSLSKDL